MIYHLVPLSLSIHAIILIMILLCLLCKKSLDWDRIELHSKNYSWTFYHYRFRLKANIEYHIPLISKNKAREKASLRSWIRLNRDYVTGSQMNGGIADQLTPPPTSVGFFVPSTTMDSVFLSNIFHGRGTTPPPLPPHPTPQRRLQHWHQHCPWWNVWTQH